MGSPVTIYAGFSVVCVLMSLYLEMSRKAAAKREYEARVMWERQRRERKATLYPQSFYRPRSLAHLPVRVVHVDEIEKVLTEIPEARVAPTLLPLEIQLALLESMYSQPDTRSEK